MPRSDDAILRFEQQLRLEVDRFGRGLRLHLAAEGAHDPAACGVVRDAERLQALVAEDARLRRKARRGAACYDLNRHIAVRRLLALGSAPAVSA